MKVSTIIWLKINLWIASKHFEMYITINDIVGEKIINLAYPILDTEVAVVIMLNDNVQYWLKGPMKILLKTGKEITLMKEVHTDKELNAMIGLELKTQMASHDVILRKNKLENLMKMGIILDELDNADNLEDGSPSNTLFTYHVSSPKYFTHFEPKTPQYKKLRNGMITSMTLKIKDKNDKIVANGLGTTVVLHIR